MSKHPTASTSPWLKALVLLSLLQVGLLLFLSARIAAIDDAGRAAAPVEARLAAQKETPDAEPARPDHINYNIIVDHQLRTIVREELAAHAAILSNPDALAPELVETEPVDAGNYSYRFESVTQKLDYYESRGSISDAEMHDLQSDIMALNEADRAHALSRLATAINKGDLEGRL